MATDLATWALRDRVALPTGTIAVDVLGADRPGVPVVLTHGTPSWSYLWRHVAPALAQDRPVHLWDLPTYGDSTGERPSVDGHARTLAALVDHWGVDAPVLVGHDIGAATTLRAHLVHGTPAGALVLVDAAVLSPWVTGATQHVRAHLDTYREMPNHLFTAMITAHLRTTVAGALADDAEWAYLARYAGPEGQQRYLDQVAGFTEDDTRDVVARLGEVAVPTDVVWGAEDTWIPRTAGSTLRNALPGAQLHIVPGAGHFLPEEASDTLIDLLNRTLP
ncbi:pimeloyl-ACP methyl ester carboxylesterase [Actinomycetospora succinea]|uniref:Pimeloyl-ACP methyl ester carboxylesterase n=1 Tax=Actinomycetospora succinea TaxID=663603 RepID=A0A4R6VGS2_9PSEU|nr:alpha/beta hydrolase [Actinomycetospora succinea]TDQ60557.1 pimeloyl-ACP methyl ester carboxylesterase [Actinomycetospora succinea]